MTTALTRSDQQPRAQPKAAPVDRQTLVLKCVYIFPVSGCGAALGAI